jgi:hypothetical protein
LRKFGFVTWLYSWSSLITSGGHVHLDAQSLICSLTIPIAFLSISVDHCPKPIKWSSHSRRRPNLRHRRRRCIPSSPLLLCPCHRPTHQTLHNLNILRNFRPGGLPFNLACEDLVRVARHTSLVQNVLVEVLELGMVAPLDVDLGALGAVEFGFFPDSEF